MSGTQKPEVPGDRIERNFRQDVAEVRRQRIAWLIEELSHRPNLLAKETGVEQLGAISDA